MANKHVNRFAYRDDYPTANLERERRNRELLERQRRLATATLPPLVPDPAKISELSEQLSRLSAMLEANPDDPNLHRRFFETFQALLEQDAFLAFEYQSDKLYRVTTRTGLPINVPKERAPSAPYPVAKSTALNSSIRMFQISVLGLFLGGVPTFFAAPMVMWRLLVALMVQRLTYADKVKATTLMFSSFLLFAVAIVLSILLIIHLVA